NGNGTHNAVKHTHRISEQRSAKGKREQERERVTEGEMEMTCTGPELTFTLDELEQLVGEKLDQLLQPTTHSVDANHTGGSLHHGRGFDMSSDSSDYDCATSREGCTPRSLYVVCGEDDESPLFQHSYWVSPRLIAPYYESVAILTAWPGILTGDWQNSAPITTEFADS
ncbi:hypothetical protein T492DRAFT_381985, partial [Pavlovales sp. CCMP2436]